MTTTSTTARPSPMTAEQFLDLPDVGVERALICGELREWGNGTDEGGAATTGNPEHTGTESRVVYRLMDWLRRQPQPRGEIHSGEVAVRLRGNPDTFVGIDVAYFGQGTPIGSRGRRRYFDGPPILAVEILSPSDQQEEILSKVEEYFANGVRLVWVLEPHFRTVTVYQPGVDPVMFNVSQDLDGGPHLPGFRAPVAEFFAD